MSYKVEYLPEYPVVIITFNEDFKIPDDMLAYVIEAASFLDAEAHPIPVIIDITPYTMSLDGLLQATKAGGKGDANIAVHPNVSKVIVVTKATLIKMSLDGIRKLGLAREIEAATSLEEALKLV